MLLLHDAAAGGLRGLYERTARTGRPDVRLVDFAHAHPSADGRRDDNLHAGLAGLARQLRALGAGGEEPPPEAVCFEER